MKCRGCNNKSERQGLICSECRNEPFEIASVCRADLQSFFSEAEIAKLDDDHIASIARKMAGAYCDQVFWIDAEILARHVLEDL